MKKFLAMLLCLALCLAVLPSVAETASTPSVCIVVAGNLGDRSFYDSSNEGIQQLKADFGTEIGVLECSEDASLYETYLFEAAAKYQVVCAVGWQFWDALESGDVLASYPDVKFIFIDNGLDGCGDNLMSIVYSANQGSFLVGYIAAKMSTTGVIGVVGGEDCDTINDFIIGYEAGASLANPNVQVKRQYSNDYEDPAKGKDCALALYDEGCDIVYAVAGKTGEGVFEAAAQCGKLAIGVDSDQKYINPDVIICSMVKRVGTSIYDVVAHMDTMYQGGQIWTADMASGYIDVGFGTEDMTQQVSDELKAEVAALRQQIIDGTIVVPSAFD